MIRPMRHDMSQHTEFFRDANLVWACDRLLPKLAQGLGRQMLLGEVGCGDGQETWTIASLLKNRKVDFHIDGLDQSAAGFARARSGIYTPYRSFEENHRNTGAPDGCLDYFTDARTRSWRDPVRVDSSLLSHATFEEYSAFDPLPAAKYDVITAFNFLYYYHPDDQRMLMGNMVAGLRPGGYFLRDNGQRNDPDWLPITQEFGLEPAEGSHQWPSTIFQLAQ
jgi:chemotaxis methyl-accepting protein methylase